MKRFLRFLISSIVVVTVAFGIFKLTNKYNLHVVNKDIDWSITLKGYEGAICFDYDLEGNLYIAFNDTIRVINTDGKEEVIIRENDFDILDMLCHKDKLLLATGNKVIEYDVNNNKIKELITNIPNSGENKRVKLLIKDNLLYIAIGSNTNSGIVSQKGMPKDIATTTWTLTGNNYGTDPTGAFSDYAVKKEKGEQVKGETLGNGSIITYDLNSSEISMFAHGIRNIEGWDIDGAGSLIGIVGGMEDEGLRAVKDDKDYLYKFENNAWYGWPDYSGGDPITSPRFTDGEIIEFLIENHLDKTPPAPMYQHRDVSSMSGFAIDKEGKIFSNESMIFADNNIGRLYSLSKEGVLNELLDFGEGSTVEDIGIYGDNLFILESNLGCLYKIKALDKGDLFKLPKAIWLFVIIFSITILVGVIYKLNKKLNRK